MRRTLRLLAEIQPERYAENVLDALAGSLAAEQPNAAEEEGGAVGAPSAPKQQQAAAMPTLIAPAGGIEALQRLERSVADLHKRFDRRFGKRHSRR